MKVSIKDNPAVVQKSRKARQRVTRRSRSASDKVLAGKLVDWEQIEEGRREAKAGGGVLLSEVPSNAASQADDSRCTGSKRA
jgi:hypothetical protein